MVREDYSQSSLLTTLVGKPTDRYIKYNKDIDTLKGLTDQFGKPNNRLHYSIYPQIQNEYQATLTQLEALDFYSPVVEVIGNITTSHRVNTPYNDQGVIINDFGSELVSTTSTVDENTFGTYQVVYTATDGINEDTVVKRTVKVGLPPDVTINGNNPYFLQRFHTFIDPGVTINDSNSYLQSTTSTIISDVEGVYTVNYTVTNPAFTEIFSREVRVVDTVAPVITILGDNPYTLERFDRYIDDGATVDQGSVLTNTNLDDVQNTQIGSFDVVYTAYDGNSTTIETRTVNVVDTVPPDLNILGGLSVTLERFAEYVDLGAETDLGSQITVDLSNVDNTLPHGSTFDVVYTASDGNTLHDVTQTRTVTIQDTIPPSIKLLGDNPYFMEPEYNFADLDPGYEVDIGTSVSVNYSAINNTQAGVYDVIYTASDGVNQDVVLTRTVEVADRVPPIVTILGDNPYTLERYDIYTDDGATIDIGSTLVSTTSTVDNTEVGTYTVTYEAADGVNENTIVTRTVNVVDTNAPIVTLNNPELNPITLERFAVFADIDPGIHMAADQSGTLVSVDISELDNTAQGTYTVTYNVVDDQNNSNLITRGVTVVDTDPPVVTLREPTTSYTLERFALWSEIDPGVDIDEGSYIHSVSVNNTQIGVQTVTYDVRDGTNITTVTRVITVSDTVAPVITLNPPTSVTVERYSTYTDLGATVDEGSEITNVDTSSVDTNSVGEYTVTYTAYDGNTYSTATRTVNVVDTTGPSIVLNDYDPDEVYQVQRYSTYVEPGASAGVFAVNIDSSQVNTSIVGTYYVTYTASDQYQNSTTVYRRVDVIDTIGPVITLEKGDSEETTDYTVERFTTYTDPGYSADGGETVTVTGTVNMSVVGNYTLTYSATDDQDNTTTVTRLVTVQDTTGPVITLEKGDSEETTDYTVERYSTYTDPGYSADGGETVTVTGTVNMSVVGNYTLTYSATDDQGNTSSVTRLVTVQDTTGPVITLSEFSQGTIDYTLERFGTYVEPGASAGIFSVSIDTSNIDASNVGTYYVTYTSTDENNNTTTRTRTVYVVDTTPPVITLNTTPDIPISPTVERYSVYTDPGATATGPDGTFNVTTTGEVDTSTVGTYTLTYTATDDHNNSSTATRTVTVEDTTGPVITLEKGDSEETTDYTVERFTTYTDPGYSADGGETVTVTGTVNMSVVGNYTLTYTATDDQNNTSSVVRNVYVRDTNAPIVTIIGSNPDYVQRGSNTPWVDAGSSSTNEDIESTTLVSTTIRNPDGNIRSVIDSSVLGDWTVTYVRSDGYNTGSATRTVTVQDTTDPDITILGDDPYYVEYNSNTWIDQGSSADETTTVSVTITDPNGIGRNDVSNIVIGTWVVTYTHTDVALNTSSASREVIVQDTVSPFVTVTGSDPYYVELGTGAWIDQGSSVTDESSASLTSTTIRNPSDEVESSIDNTVIGDWTVTYVYTDVHNNIGSNVRTVTVRDTTGPDVTVLGSNPYYVELGTGAWTDEGSSAFDYSTKTLTSTTIRNPSNAVKSSIDNTVIGDWTVTYVYTDAYNNEGSAVRTVTVRDTTDPDVTINGNNPYYVELGTGAWTDQGSSATDESSASLTSTTIRNPSDEVESSIDNTVIGDWTVTYVYTDAHGNTGSAVRTVTVRDTTDPDVTVLGNNPYYVELGTGAWTDQGSSVTDESSASLTSTTIRNPSNVVKGSIDNTVIGDWEVTYVYTDAHGNTGSAVRTVTVRDTTDPDVTVLGSNPYYVELGTGAWTDEGSSATDESTVTFTSKTIRNPSDEIESSIDNTVIGDWEVTYVYTDAHGNTGSAVRIVTVRDTTGPTVFISGDNPYYVEFGTGGWTDQGSSATDESTTSLTSMTIRNPSDEIESTINNAVIGDWTVTYLYTDIHQNTGSNVRTVTVQDTTDPVVTVTGSNPYYVERGTGAWIDDGSSATDESTVTFTSKTIRNPSNVVQSSINNEVVGNWTVTYVYTDAHGNTGSNVRTVTVRDTTGPIVSISGDNPYYVEYKSNTWINQGSTATDYSTKSLTGLTIRNPSDEIESTINNAVIGDWTVTYLYTDAYENTGSNVRTVTVQDTTAPIVTIAGQNPYLIQKGSGNFSEPGTSYIDHSIASLTSATIRNPSNVVELSINNEVVGNWTITYVYTDIHQNTGSNVRTVRVQDTDGPTVTVNPGNDVVQAYTGTWIDEGSSYSDASTATLTKTIRDPSKTVRSSINNNVIGTWTVTYLYTDAYGNTGSAERSVVVSDTVGPVITVNPGTDTVEAYTGSWTDEGSSATDSSTPTYVGRTIIDPNNASKTSISNDIIGTWVVTYTYKDAYENYSSATRNVVVRDTTDPVVTVLGNNPYYVQYKTDTWIDDGSSATDGSTTTFTSKTILDPSQTVRSSIDNTVIGDWRVTYVYTDLYGNTGSNYRTVRVQDTIDPVVTVLGNNPYYVEHNSNTWSDEGSSVSDLSLTTYTQEIYNPDDTKVSSFSNGTLGDWKIRYIYTDVSGNVGYADRTVTVLDTDGPVITILGDNPYTMFTTDTYTEYWATSDGGETVTRSGYFDQYTPGTYYYTYSATDTSGNTGSAVRTIVVQAPPSGCFSDKTRVIMSDSSVRNLRDVLVGDELEGGIRVDAILQIRNIHSVPFYKLLDENTRDYIYVTGSHKIKYGGEFIYVKDHPDSVITDRVERTWLCLITDNHTIPIGGHIFWDWADMCDACEKPVISS